MKVKGILLAAAVACGMAAAVSPAQALVIGAPDTSSSYPFGSSMGGYFYQQVYSAANFSGPLTINQITFYNSLSPSTTTPLGDTFTFYLSTTNAAVPSFDTSAMTFPDASFNQVFSGKLGAIVDGRLDIALSSAFTYNPALGNLVLTIKDFDLGSGGNLFLDADKNVGVTNMRTSAYPYEYNQGLVTGFNDKVAAVPEPATWAMMIAGFGLAGAVLRRRRAHGPVAACA